MTAKSEKQVLTLCFEGGRTGTKPAMFSRPSPLIPPPTPLYKKGPTPMTHILPLPPASSIRKMSPQDIDGVYKIETDCFESEAWPRDDFEYIACCEPRYVTALVYILDGKVAGYISGSCVMGELEINSVAVDKKLRNRGIATALINALEKAEEPDRAFLEVRTSNAPARSLYSALGFEEYGIRKKYYTAPEEDAVLMRKEYRRK